MANVSRVPVCGAARSSSTLPSCTRGNQPIDRRRADPEPARDTAGKRQASVVGRSAVNTAGGPRGTSLSTLNFQRAGFGQPHDRRRIAETRARLPLDFAAVWRTRRRARREGCARAGRPRPHSAAPDQQPVFSVRREAQRHEIHHGADGNRRHRPLRHRRPMSASREQHAHRQRQSQTERAQCPKAERHAARPQAERQAARPQAERQRRYGQGLARSAERHGFAARSAPRILLIGDETREHPRAQGIEIVVGRPSNHRPSRQTSARRGAGSRDSPRARARGSCFPLAKGAALRRERTRANSRASVPRTPASGKSSRIRSRNGPFQPACKIVDERRAA